MIDWERVTELRDEVGPDDFGEVVDLFIEEVESTIAKLRSNLDLATLEDDLHFLKGAALNLGFQAFSDLCQKGEHMAGAGQAADVDLPSILDCFDASRNAFTDELPGRLAA